MVSQQEKLFDLVSGLEGLRTLIISDGYVPRKDRGSINTDILLDKMSKARNLQVLDLQRLQLESQDQVDLLSEFLELHESVEELRLTGMFVNPEANLDSAIEACCEMPNLRSLSISAARKDDSSMAPQRKTCLIQNSLRDLLQSSSTLQDLSLRSMHLTDAQCETIADTLSTSSFLTSLDIRQNDGLTHKGYAAILQALERNYDLWCSVLVDNDTFQAKFNSLIELNQANRGDLLRSPTKEKLIVFLDKLKDDPTALMHFFTIHDAILFPMVEFLALKNRLDKARSSRTSTISSSNNNKRPLVLSNDQQQQQQQEAANVVSRAKKIRIPSSA
eukprot:scaffold8673_cov126-Cylindrotheca_fusiformis.AAC.4